MIDALMYGMMPSAKIESCSSAPPENMLNSPKNVPCSARRTPCITLGSTPGVDDDTPMR